MNAIRPSGSWNPDRPDATAITRVTSYVNAASLHPTGVPIARVAHDGRVYDLTLDDLGGLLGIVAELCPDHERCAKCGAVSCESCAVGEPLTECDPPHCSTDPWCFDRACADAQAEDAAVDAAEDAEVMCP